MKDRKGVFLIQTMEWIPWIRQSRMEDISTHCPKDNLIDPVLRYMLSLLFVMSFLKEIEELIKWTLTYSDQQ